MRPALRAVVVVTRHGARSPGINIRTASTPEAMAVEETRWRGLVPDAATLTALGYNDRFPVYCQGEPLDAMHHAWPWGQLSLAGLQQTAAVGDTLREHYGRAFDRAQDSDSLQVLSSNFVRTQLSAQSVLSTLQGKGAGRAVPITARHQTICPIAVFQNASGLRELCEASFDGSASLRSAEVAAQPLRHALHVHMPSLLPHASSSRGPEYMWSHIVDFFACSHTHGWAGEDVALTPLPRLAELGDGAMSHVTWRFSSLFRIPGALPLALRGLFAELYAVASGCLHGRVGDASAFPSSPSAGVKFELLSGHDVTIFPLLVFLHACSGLPHPVGWPGFAAFLTLEVVSVSGEAGDAVLRWRFWDPFPFPAPPSGNSVLEEPPAHDIPIRDFFQAAHALVASCQPARG